MFVLIAVIVGASYQYLIHIIIMGPNDGKELRKQTNPSFQPMVFGQLNSR